MAKEEGLARCSHCSCRVAGYQARTKLGEHVLGGEHVSCAALLQLNKRLHLRRAAQTSLMAGRSDAT